MVVPRKGRLGVAELPCRLVDPDLFFAEAPSRCGGCQGICAWTARSVRRAWLVR